MACQKGYVYCLLLTCIVLASFSGCRTAITRKDFDNLANYPLIIDGKVQEPKKPETLQYYISKKVKLELYETPQEYTVDKNGKLIVKVKAIRKNVTIPAGKKGKLLDHDGYIILEVGFEKNHTNCTIKFKLREGYNDYYYLYYDNEKNHTINYGDAVYKVILEGNDLPYLEIKKKLEPYSVNDKRNAIGWNVDEE